MKITSTRGASHAGGNKSIICFTLLLGLVFILYVKVSLNKNDIQEVNVQAPDFTVLNSPPQHRLNLESSLNKKRNRTPLVKYKSTKQEERYAPYLSDEEFVTNFPFTKQYATNSWKQTHIRDWSEEERQLRRRHHFVFGFYNSPNIDTKAFQILTETFRDNGLPLDPYAYGMIFNKLINAAAFRRAHQANPSEYNTKLLQKALRLEYSIAASLLNENLWWSGAPNISKDKASAIARELKDKLDPEKHIGDFNSFAHVVAYGGKDPDKGKRFLIK